jgi:hypothetical protein
MNPAKDTAFLQTGRSIKSDDLEFVSASSGGCFAVRDTAVTSVGPGRGPTASPCPNAFGAVSAGTGDWGSLTLYAVNASSESTRTSMTHCRTPVVLCHRPCDAL